MAEVGRTLLAPKPVKVEVAGTAVQLPTVEATGTAGKKEGDAAKSVVVQALSTNTEAVVVGGKEVKAKAGTQAAPEQQGIELAAKQTITFDIMDSGEIWVDARTSKDGVSFVILVA